MTKSANTARRALLLNLVLLSGSLVVAALVLEGVLRLVPSLMPPEAQLRTQWSKLSSEIVSIADPDIGFVYPPNYHGHVQRDDFEFSYTTDEHGFRNASPWPEHADVVAVGDSETFGYGVEDDEAWSRLVLDELSPLTLVNLGLIGAAPQQYERAFKKLGAALTPKVVLFGLFPGNDLSDARDFERWLSAGAQGSYDVWRFFGGAVPDRGIGRMLGGSYLLTTVRELRKSLRSPFSGRTIDFPDGSKLRLAPGLVAGNAERARPGDPDFALVMDAIERTRSLAREQGATLVVLLFPTKEEVYLPVLGDPSPDPIGPFDDVLSERGIPHLDLTPYLQEGARANERLFFEVDGHPNAEGYRVIADVVADHLRANADRYGLTVLDSLTTS